MKKWYVYEIINLMGTVEYVGETIRPKQRWAQHKCNSKCNKNDGKFYGRNDVRMNIVAEFNSKKDAFNYQCELQLKYGFETDEDKFKKQRILGGKAAGIVNGLRLKLSGEIQKLGKLQSSKIHTCPHCNKIGQSSSMFRWHFDNCKHKVVK
jgi:predicted GIY-YIG superfamily endonuclease